MIPFQSYFRQFLRLKVLSRRRRPALKRPRFDFEALLLRILGR